MSEPKKIPIIETAEANRKTQVISAVCRELTAGHVEIAEAILKEKYPFVPLRNVGRSDSSKPTQSLKIFVRDGFVDRYSGLRMLFPGALRLLSLRMPDVFPFHKNGKTDQCHFAFWELFPTVDHVIPVSRDGPDDPTNWVTTSMSKNAAKANFTLEEINWQLLPGGDIKDWDGELSWFMSEVKKDSTLLNIPYIARWKKAADSFQMLKSDLRENSSA
jgi:hypothetical protein